MFNPTGSPENAPTKKTTMQNSNEFALKLQGGFALAEAIRMVETTKDSVSPEEYEAQMEVIAQIAENLADFIPEA